MNLLRRRLRAVSAAKALRSALRKAMRTLGDSKASPRERIDAARFVIDVAEVARLPATKRNGAKR